MSEKNQTTRCPRCERPSTDGAWCDDCAALAYSICDNCDRHDATHAEDLVYCLGAGHDTWHVENPTPFLQLFGLDVDHHRLFIAEPECWRLGSPSVASAMHTIRVLNVLVCDRCRTWQVLGDGIFTGSLYWEPPADYRQDVGWLRRNRYLERV